MIFHDVLSRALPVSTLSHDARVWQASVHDAIPVPGPKLVAEWGRRAHGCCYT